MKELKALFFIYKPQGIAKALLVVLRVIILPYKKIDISSAAYDPSSDDVYPFYVNRLSPSASKRSHQTAFQFTLNYLLYLETLGSRIVNGSHTVLLETSKAYQAALLQKLQIPHPKSLVLNDLRHLDKYIHDFTFPVLLKPNCGGSGIGIQKFLSREELLTAREENRIQMPEERLLLLQELLGFLKLLALFSQLVPLFQHQLVCRDL